MGHHSRWHRDRGRAIGLCVGYGVGFVQIGAPSKPPGTVRPMTIAVGSTQRPKLVSLTPPHTPASHSAVGQPHRRQRRADRARNCCPGPERSPSRWETLAAVLGAVIIALAAAVLQPLSFRQPARPSPSHTRSPGRVERAHRMRTAQHTALMAPAAGQLPRLRRRRCPRRRPALRHVGQGPRRAHVHRGCAHCA